MSLLVDTGVLLLALRRDVEQSAPEVVALSHALLGADHIQAADVRNTCRRRGVQVGTIDALLIQLCRRNDLTLLTTDQDFHAATKHVEFRLWSAG